MEKPLYLAGPMTGYPQFNYPAFIDAAEALRDRGYDILSPVELDSAPWVEAALKSKDGKLDDAEKVGGATWGEILSRDVEVIADRASGVILLQGWQHSRGARLETFVARQCGLDIFVYMGAGIIVDADPEKIEEGLLRL